MINGVTGLTTTPPESAAKSVAAGPTISNPGNAVNSTPTPDQAKPATASRQPEQLQGFNPSAKIDPDTHIVVLTVSAPDGTVIRQMPNKQQLEAYKASLAKH